MRKFFSTLVAAALFGFAGSASAATVSFNFEDAVAGAFPSVSYTTGLVTLDVTGSGGNIGRTSNGIGIKGDPNNNRLGGGEGLNFVMSREILSLTADLREQSNFTERFFVTINGIDSAPQTLPAQNGTQTRTIDLLALFDPADLPAALTSFSINGLDGTNGSGNRGIFVSGIQAAVVPLPAAGVLLVTALGGLALVGRRRRAAATAA